MTEEVLDHADHDRILDDGFGELGNDAPDPGDPPDVHEVDTDWEPTADDDLEDDDADQ